MSFAAMMEQLKKEYIESLPEKMAQIQKHIELQAHDAIREDFHKLKGTGSTYGLPEVSTLAQVVEDICIQDISRSVDTATKALEILQDIYSSRASESSYSIETDLRFAQITSRTNP